MPESEEDLTRRFEELNNKLRKLNGKTTQLFSVNSLLEFGRDFFNPLIGSLSFLIGNTTTHKSIQCIATGMHIPTHHINDNDSYDNFIKDLVDIESHTTIDFVFNMSQSIYNIGDVQEKFSVYLKEDGYEVVYVHQDKRDLRFLKKYLTCMDPNEIREFRDAISNSVLAKVSFKIDTLLEI